MYNAIFQYNDLDQRKVTRSQLLELVKLAQEEKQNFIVQKISALLQENPDDKCFRITLKNKIPTYQIQDGILGAFEPVPEELQEEDGEILTNGLNATNNIKSYIDYIEKLYEKLNIKQDTAMFYKNPSALVQKYPKIKNYIPYSYISKKPYKGNNILSLAFGQQNITEFKNPYFITKKQVEKRNGTIKKNATPRQLFFFTEVLDEATETAYPVVKK